VAFLVGLTGNIASGKSAVAAQFATLGIDVISADQIAKALTARQEPAFYKIIDHFGTSILTTEGELDRRLLRQLIFNDATERLWLESLLHPLIRQAIRKEAQKCQSPYGLIEIPLIPDKAHYPYLNRILLVVANQDLQIARIMARDNCSKEHALAILATQADEKKHRLIADDVLINNGSIEQLQQQVKALHERYLQCASQEKK